jgi:hypothetical protein
VVLTSLLFVMLGGCFAPPYTAGSARFVLHVVSSMAPDINSVASARPVQLDQLPAVGPDVHIQEIRMETTYAPPAACLVM